MGTLRFRIQIFLVCGLIAATALGFFLRPASRVETEIFIPIEIVNFPHGLAITGLNVKGVEATVKGSPAALKKLAEHKLRYPVDLTNAVVGLLNISILTDKIQLPRGLEIIQIKPSFLTGMIVEIQSKTVPVKIKSEGKPAPGFEIAAITAKPETIMLQGAKNSLINIESITTKPIDISGRSETFRIETALEHPDFPDVIATPNVIIAEIAIHERNITRKFKDISVDGKNGAYPFTITPDALDIEVKGPANAIDTLDLKVYVDLKGLKPGVYVRRAVIALPVRFMLVRVKPEVFTVKIGK